MVHYKKSLTFESDFLFFAFLGIDGISENL